MKGNLKRLAAVPIAVVLASSACAGPGTGRPSATASPSAPAPATPTPLATAAASPAPTPTPVLKPVPIGHFSLTKSVKPEEVAAGVLRALGVDPGEFGPEVNSGNQSNAGETSVGFPQIAEGSWWVVWGDTGQLDRVWQDAGNQSAPAAITVSDADALKRAREYLDAVGIPLPTADADYGVVHDTGGPLMTWGRVADGFGVPDDGWSVSLTGDGRLASLSYSWHKLAAKPAHVITAKQALARIKDACEATSGDDFGGCGEPDLMWTTRSSDHPDSSIEHLEWVVHQFPGYWYIDPATGKATFSQT